MSDNRMVVWITSIIVLAIAVVLLVLIAESFNLARQPQNEWTQLNTLQSNCQTSSGYSPSEYAQCVVQGTEAIKAMAQK